MAEYVQINPAILKWARERSGYTVEDVAKWAKVSVDKVQRWEDGSEPLAISRFEAFARHYKRPTALFYADVPPEEPDDAPPDFRNQSGPIGPELRLQLRFARERRADALELLRQVGTAPMRFEFQCVRTESPATVGARLRGRLGVQPEKQRTWGDDSTGYAGLNGWKEHAEQSGVLVFQSSRRAMGGARGFSVYWDALPVVVLSSEDQPTGRTFTLLHELAHIGLRETGICDLHDGGIERFCNTVAAAALMPADSVRSAAREVGHRVRDDWTQSTLRQMCKRFGVSEEALVLRLVELGSASQAFYDARAAMYRLRALEAGSRSGGFVPPHVKAVAANGRAFTRLVLEAYHRDLITEYRAATYLRVNHEHLSKIENDMARFPTTPREAAS